MELFENGGYWEIKVALDQLRMKKFRQIMTDLKRLDQAFIKGKYHPELIGIGDPLPKEIYKLAQVKPMWIGQNGFPPIQSTAIVKLRFTSGTDGQVVDAVAWLCKNLEVELK